MSFQVSNLKKNISLVHLFLSPTQNPKICFILFCIFPQDKGERQTGRSQRKEQKLKGGAQKLFTFFLKLEKTELISLVSFWLSMKLFNMFHRFDVLKVD